MDTPTPLALQLYSLREAADRDLPGTLAAVAAAGYQAVELAGLYGHSPAAVRGWLADQGLAVTSAHVGTRDEATLPRSLDELVEVGVTSWVIPWAPPERFADLAAVHDLAEEIAGRAEMAAARGLSLGYHNHEFELASNLDGEPALIHLFRALDPAVIAEVDIYWAQVGGVDPAALVAELGSRVQLLHVKDGPARHHDDDHVAVGTGSVDIPGVLAAATSARWHIVELDRCATDMLTAVQASARWLTGRGLSQGRA
jgi:sugar phosphate isomerase/epimerase